jgi:hypothetical protein
MKIKNSIFENNQYYKTFEKIHQSDQLSVMDAFHINRLAKKLNKLKEEYFELKKGILEKFGTLIEDEEGQPEGQFNIEDDNKEEFMKELNVLWAIEHDLEIKKLSFPSKIKDGISAADLSVLELFFDLSTLEKSSNKK